MKNKPLRKPRITALVTMLASLATQYPVRTVAITLIGGAGVVTLKLTTNKSGSAMADLDAALLFAQWHKDVRHRPADWDYRANKLPDKWREQVEHFQMVERMQPGEEQEVIDKLQGDSPYDVYLTGVVLDYWGERIEDDAAQPKASLPDLAKAKYYAAIDWYKKAASQLNNNRRMQARALLNRAAVNMSLAQHDGNEKTRRNALEQCVEDCKQGLAAFPMAIGYGTEAGALAMLCKFDEMDRVLKTGLTSRMVDEQNPSYLAEYVSSEESQSNEFSSAVRQFPNWLAHIRALQNEP